MFRLAVVIAISLAAPAAAQIPNKGLTLGVTAFSSTSALKGDSDQTMIIPMIQYQGNGFTIGPISASLRVMEQDQLEVALVAAPRFSAIDGAEGDFLDGLSRDLTLDMGVEAKYKLAEKTSASFTLKQEITGEHDGQEIKLSMRHTVMAGPVPIGFSVSAAWQSEDLAGYLYGVHADEARPGRPAYAPGDAWVTSFSIDSGVPLSKNMFLLGRVGMEMLPYEATQSPIVEKDSTTNVSLGIIYLF